MARYTNKDANGHYYIESANGKLESNIKGHTYGKAIDRFAELENAEVEFGDQIDYVHGVFFGTADRLSEIDGLIADAAQGWTIARLSKVTVSIMRLAIYEMLAVEDVPKRVALNEAVELAKKYDEDSAPAFINGVLNTISHKLPDKECDK
jgi:N utilization substance protein B